MAEIFISRPSLDTAAANFTGNSKNVWTQETLLDTGNLKRCLSVPARCRQILSPVIGRRQDDDKMVSDQFGRDTKVCFTITISGRILP